MAEVILIRHGQASFGAANYDQLSDLGQQQSLWLGQQLALLGYQPDRLVMGAMARHRQTALGIKTGLGQELIEEIQPGLDEYDFAGLLAPLKDQFSWQWQATGHSKRDYYANMTQALHHWIAGTIATDGLDSWESFRKRVLDAFDSAFQPNKNSGQIYKKIQVVTSGGPIAVVLAHLLGLNPDTTVKTMMQIKNTSCTKFLFNSQGYTLDGFNELSHLQQAGRSQAITFS